jgi:hypothetical protein
MFLHMTIFYHRKFIVQNLVNTYLNSLIKTPITICFGPGKPTSICCGCYLKNRERGKKRSHQNREKGESTMNQTGAKKKTVNHPSAPIFPSARVLQQKILAYALVPVKSFEIKYQIYPVNEGECKYSAYSSEGSRVKCFHIAHVTLSESSSLPPPHLSTAAPSFYCRVLLFIPFHRRYFPAPRPFPSARPAWLQEEEGSP